MTRLYPPEGDALARYRDDVKLKTFGEWGLAPFAELMRHREVICWWAAELDLLPDAELEFAEHRAVNLEYCKLQLAEIDREIGRRQRVAQSRYAPHPPNLPEANPRIWQMIKDGFDLKEYIEIEAGIRFRRAGKLWVASCPLRIHTDTTPSFFVYPDQHYHCFGCHNHGSVIDFVMTIYRMTFSNALDLLIKMANHAVPNTFAEPNAPAHRSAPPSSGTQVVIHRPDGEDRVL
jgi:hypothetical protein